MRGNVKAASIASGDPTPARKYKKSLSTMPILEDTYMWELVHGKENSGGYLEYLSRKGISSDKTDLQITPGVVSGSDEAASLSKEADNTVHQPLSGIGSARSGIGLATPAKNKKVATKTADGANVAEAEDSDEQITPTKVTYKQTKAPIDPIVSATPQRQFPKPVSSAAMKQEPNHDDNTNTTTANPSNDM